LKLISTGNRQRNKCYEKAVQQNRSRSNRIYANCEATKYFLITLTREQRRQTDVICYCP